MKAFWNYYLAISCFNAPVCIVVSIINGFTWLPIGFCTYGLAIGILCFDFYFKNQYYFYRNLGYTKTRLVATTLVFNIIFSIPIIILIALL